jgi:hypothetical protein
MIEQRKKFATAQVASVPAERRNFPRYPCTTTAEVLDSQTGTRVNGRTSDIGKGGCYVDTLNPLPTRTAVKIQLTKDEQTFAAQGKVCYAMPGLGMGLAFTSVEPEQMWTLEKWIVESGGAPTAAPELVEKADRKAPEKNGQNEQLYVLNELIISLMRKGVLTDAEGKTLLEKLFR